MMQYIDPSSWCDGVCDHQIVWFGSPYRLSNAHSVNFNARRCCPMLCSAVTIQRGMFEDLAFQHI